MILFLDRDVHAFSAYVQYNERGMISSEVPAFAIARLHWKRLSRTVSSIFCILIWAVVWELFHSVTVVIISSSDLGICFLSKRDSFMTVGFEVNNSYKRFEFSATECDMLSSASPKNTLRFVLLSHQSNTKYNKPLFYLKFFIELQ